MHQSPKAKDLVSASVNSVFHDPYQPPQPLRFAKSRHILEPEHLSRTSEAASRQG
jgi:hypothetical protein